MCLEAVNCPYLLEIVGVEPYFQALSCVVTGRAIHISGKDALVVCRNERKWRICHHYTSVKENNMNRPWIVCLCGSTKFKKEFMEIAAREALRGHIVLMPHVFTHADELKNTKEEIDKLEALHTRQIDCCDEVIVIDVNGYTGESTSLELSYAEHIGKQINSYRQ